MKLVRFTKKGIYCIPGKFYLDPWYPVDYAVISHGHADHAKWGMQHYLCHHYTKPILQHRISADIQVESLAYNEKKKINGVTLSFHPAGHIIGSAQIRLEYKGFVVVFTGDYKTTPDGLTQPYEPVTCHEFITESTFGLPIYKWQTETVLKQSIEDWITSNKIERKTSVFLGYSLGKSQRIMKLLEGVDAIYVHTAIHNINAAITSSGLKLPKTILLEPDFDKKEIEGKLVILPPALLGSRLLKRVPNAATAICSGWMQIRGNKRWKGVDAGFPVSDHADWNGLLDAVKASKAEKVYVTHGSQAIFAKYLNEIGIPAEEIITAYGEDQLETEGKKTETA